MLDQALRLPASQVDAWLVALPDVTRHLAPRLRSLLQQHRTGACAGFMASSPRLNDDRTASSVKPGHRAGPYRLLREIGRGGMCSVWLAERAERSGRSRSPCPARQVAIKLPHRALDADTTRRMAHERDITALMDRPQVARLRGAGLDAEKRPYLVLDHVQGLPLDQWCARRQPSLQARLRLAVQLARALAYVHGLGVVHRDLKPANVLVGPRGQVHLLDFGIACRLPPAQQAEDTACTELSFTPAYASPEQRRGEPTTGASDVYSLAVLVFELLTGRLPHAPQAVVGGWLTRTGTASRECAPPLASSRAADAGTAAHLRGAIDAVLCQALAPRPAQRPASAAAVADVLQAWQLRAACPAEAFGAV
uniref:Serine/threonine protein kinase n=1 Tax=uncultured bacterium EC5 TaxID=672206 RepID=G4WV87_9BACT|nr:serine/threonine protein kinase [uncultured bacterium EC5]